LLGVGRTFFEPLLKGYSSAIVRNHDVYEFCF
jgi:hypothetical protein